MKKIFTIALLVLASVTMFAAENAAPEAKAAPAVVTTIKVNGIIADKQSNELLAGATITANGQKVYSDLDGQFTLSNIENGKVKITVSLISYEDQSFEIDAQKASTLKIELKQR